MEYDIYLEPQQSKKILKETITFSIKSSVVYLILTAAIAIGTLTTGIVLLNKALLMAGAFGVVGALSLAFNILVFVYKSEVAWHDRNKSSELTRHLKLTFETDVFELADLDRGTSSRIRLDSIARVEKTVSALIVYLGDGSNFMLPRSDEYEGLFVPNSTLRYRKSHAGIVIFITVLIMALYGIIAGIVGPLLSQIEI